MLRTCNRSCRRREGDSIRGPLNYHAGDYAGGGKVQGRVVVTVAGASDSQNVVGGACGKAQGLGGAWCLPQQPSETMSLAPTEAPWWCSLRGWMLLCGSGEVVPVTTAETAAEAMLSC